MPHPRNVRKPHKYSVNIPAKTYQPNVLVLFLKKYWPWISLTLIILFTVSIRIRLLQIPLERDEGEFAYMGQLMLQGIPPYLLAYNMKFPGIYALYALIMAAFGQTIIGIHLGLLVFNTAAIVLLFLLARRLFDDLTSVVSASVYALLSLSPTVCGTAAHATQFIVPFVLAATLLLLHALDKGKYWMIFASGFLYGLAFIIKQHAAFFVIFAVLYFITDSLRKNRMDWKRPLIGTFILISASVIPFIISCLLLYITGAFQKFWFWTITYAHQYVSLKPLSGVPREFIDHLYLVMYSGEILWAMAGLGLTGIFWDKKIKANWIFLTGLSFFSFLTIIPGFYFRNHYFITLLPVVALLNGAFISGMVRLFSARGMPSYIQALPVTVLAIALMIPVWTLRDFIFKASPIEACWMIYYDNPFVESIDIAEYIKNHSTTDDKIAILGSEPQICFYSNRKSATGYIYVYSLMESQNYAGKMQEEMIREIETIRPKYAVLVNMPHSWKAGMDSNKSILYWAKTYLTKHYRTIGVFNVAPTSYVSFWENNLTQCPAVSSTNIFVMERN
ncbi:MAG TPA: glycosyltransferase family 39 protein [Deltaproteobacteria bacterium]|nr:glycosyltransferase family 39 protein [Deltaproteobacteria bacterium]